MKYADNLTKLDMSSSDHLTQEKQVDVKRKIFDRNLILKNFFQERMMEEMIREGEQRVALLEMGDVLARKDEELRVARMLLGYLWRKMM